MNKFSFKVVLLGEGRVGKTSLVLRFCKNEFSEGQQSTIQATYLQKEVKIGEKSVTLNIWDTAGQEKFHALGPIYYRSADGALLVYDTTDKDSFVRVQNWIKELRKVVGSNIVITIAGNKCDLKNREVDIKEAEEYAAKIGGTHILTSAKANKGVEEAFLDLTRRIVDQKLAAMDLANATRGPTASSPSSQPSGAQRPMSTRLGDGGIGPSGRIGGPSGGGIRVQLDDEPAAAPSRQGGCC